MEKGLGDNKHKMEDIKVDCDIKIEVKEEILEDIKVDIKQECTECKLENIKHEIKYETFEDKKEAVTLEEYMDEAIKNNHLGLPVDADYLHEDEHRMKRIKMESVTDCSKDNSDVYPSSSLHQCNNNVAEVIVEELIDSAIPKVYKCTKCTFIASKQLSLEQHQRIIHSNRPPYQCTSCSFQTSNTTHFNSHILAHNDDKPYLCSHCTDNFSTARILNQHIASQHPEIALINCDECRFSTCNPLAMKKHIEDHSVRANAKILKCQHCSFFATKQLSLEQHQHIIHSNRPPYLCTQCSYQASTATNLNKHILAHNDDKPYLCSHCTDCFSKAGSLKKHTASRHKESTEKC